MLQCLKYAQLGILDLNSSGAAELCVELNRLLPVKFLINAILTSTTFAFGYWKLFLINLYFLIRGIMEIAEAKLDKLGVYDPREIAAKLNCLRETCRWRLCFFFALLYAYSFASVSINYNLTILC